MPGIDANTVLCLHCDGTNGSQVFDNAVAIPMHTVTAVGAAQVDTAQSKFGGASALFDGSTSRLSTPDHVDFEFSGSDFTIDFWMRVNASTNAAVVSKRTSSGTNFGPYVIYQQGLNLLAFMSSDGTTWGVVPGSSFGTLTVGQWYHVAITRSGTTFLGFLNGTQVWSVTSSASLVDNAVPLNIGANNDTTEVFNGWLDEIRFSRIPRWTSNFTPPAAPHPDDAWTVLLLHCDGADASTTFTDAARNTPTAIANAQVLTSQPKFGSAAAFFDGTGDHLQIAGSPIFDFGSGDFTIDLWIQPTILTATHRLIAHSTPGWPPFLIYQNAAQLLFYSSGNGTGWDLVSGLVITNSLTTSGWHHVAITRQGNVWRTFYDGVLANSLTVAGTVIPQGANQLTIAGAPALTDNYQGWLDEIRISKGVARWISTFTPPTAPYDTGVDAPSGGLILGGSTATTRAVAYSVGGGLVLGGSTATTRTVAYAVSAGLVLGGACATAKSYTNTPSGGIVFGGSVVQTKLYASTVSAGIVLGGSVASTRTLSLTSSGGLVLGGAAVSGFGSLIIATPVGGIALGGSVATSLLIWLYPVFDLLDGTWTDQAGGHNLWDAIDETTADDADYIVSSAIPSPADICQLRFSPAVDPTSSIGHTLVYRYGSDTDAFVTVQQALSAGQADAITDYTALSVRFEATS